MACAQMSAFISRRARASQPGVFAAGDVRYGSVKRVAGAVGEGSVAVGSVHRYLADLAAVPEESSRHGAGNPTSV